MPADSAPAVAHSGGGSSSWEEAASPAGAQRKKRAEMTAQREAESERAAVAGMHLAA